MPTSTVGHWTTFFYSLFALQKCTSLSLLHMFVAVFVDSFAIQELNEHLEPLSLAFGQDARHKGCIAPVTIIGKLRKAECEDELPSSFFKASSLNCHLPLITCTTFLGLLAGFYSRFSNPFLHQNLQAVGVSYS